MRLRPRTLLVAAGVAALLAATTGCGGDPASQASASTPSTADAVRILPGTPEPVLPVSVRSADDRTVEVDDVSRIVPLTGSIAEVVYGLGLGPNVVGRDVSTTFSEAADLPVVTQAHDVSAEGVLSLRPTLVLADSDTGPPEVIAQIRGAGVPVVVLEKPIDVAGVTEHVEAVSAAVGLRERGAELAALSRDELADVPQVKTIDGRKPLVAFLYVRGTAGVYLLGGKGSGADSMLAAVGATDAGAAQNLDTFTPLTSEALVKAAPDAILVMDKGLDSVGGIDGMLTLGGVSQTPAGRNRAVVGLEDGELLSFGPRTAETLRTLSTELDAALR